MSNYASYYKAKLEGALLYQDFVQDVFYQYLGIPIVSYASKAYQIGVGENRAGIEIKHDEKFKRTHNLWIEISEKATQREGPYIKSGIYRDDNTWLYVIGDYDTIFVFAKRQLQSIHASGKYRIIENNTKTSTGFLLPERDANRYAIIVLTPSAQKKVSKLVLDLSETGKMLHELIKEPRSDRRQMTLFHRSMDCQENGDNAPTA